MHNIYQAESDFTVREIEDLFFNQAKLLTKKMPAKRW